MVVLIELQGDGTIENVILLPQVHTLTTKPKPITMVSDYRYNRITIDNQYVYFIMNVYHGRTQ